MGKKNCLNALFVYKHRIALVYQRSELPLAKFAS